MTGPTAADHTLERIAEGVWLGGSPLRLFRLSAAGDRILAGVIRSGTWDPASGSESDLRDRLVAAGALHPRPGDDPPPRTASEVTVVVPVRDDTEGLEALLGDLATAGVAQVVVVDDGSVDASGIERVASGRARVVRRPCAGGPAAARNAGLSMVRTSLVAFVDSDVRCPDGWLSPLLWQLGDGGAAVVAPRVVASGRGLLARYEAIRGPLDMGAEPARVSPLSRVPYVPSAALVADADTIRAVGGFDESLRFGEDVDLVWRVVGSGRSVRYEPVSVVQHRTRGTFGSWLRQHHRYGTSAAMLHRRHRGLVAPVVVSPWSAAAWTLSAAGHPFGGLAVAAGSAVALARKLEGVPARRSLALAASGHLGAGRQLARAVIRPWAPASLVAAVVSRRARGVLAASTATTVLSHSGGPIAGLGGLVEDLAYTSGVWAGAVRSRSVGALMPRVTEWP